ncbi:uncharacterized protein MONBRDRAFT_9336 [Monosiga brevicollis MX1]|uniref:Uncharacterized protein n=1 Tax=Monosiga brevicollis TaxID=81824 RepID=A9V2U0_MONBE|nr:uncharacterized protein MONBRDRAFT_9336 [Monosiga brevicollis MX1]EDQ88073.1 predicted protein [Monosiga brevicollis MX1]|eukprot:XP_001747149.1 hypothetical protein [Monosiga brevicollis MX1]
MRVEEGRNGQGGCLPATTSALKASDEATQGIHHRAQRALDDLPAHLQPFAHQLWADHVHPALIRRQQESLTTQAQLAQAAVADTDALAQLSHQLDARRGRLAAALDQLRHRRCRLRAQRCWQQVRRHVLARQLERLQASVLRKRQHDMAIDPALLHEDEGAAPARRLFGSNTVTVPNVPGGPQRRGPRQRPSLIFNINKQDDTFFQKRRLPRLSEHTSVFVPQHAADDLRHLLEEVKEEAAARQAHVAQLQRELEALVRLEQGGNEEDVVGSWTDASERAARVLRLVTSFERLFSQGFFRDAAVLGVTGLNGTLRTPQTAERFADTQHDADDAWAIFAEALLRHRPTQAEVVWVVQQALLRSTEASHAYLVQWAQHGLLQGHSAILWLLWLHVRCCNTHSGTSTGTAGGNRLLGPHLSRPRSLSSSGGTERRDVARLASAHLRAKAIGSSRRPSTRMSVTRNSTMLLSSARARRDAAAADVTVRRSLLLTAVLTPITEPGEISASILIAIPSELQNVPAFCQEADARAWRWLCEPQLPMPTGPSALSATALISLLDSLAPIPGLGLSLAADPDIPAYATALARRLIFEAVHIVV